MKENIKTISAGALNEQLARDPHIELVDVRTPAEFGEIHATPARNVPLDSLNPRELLNTRNGSTGKPLYLICKSGSRGEMACKKFLKEGFTDVYNVEGGTESWAAAGLPVVEGKKVMSLERQVRIAAGSLVLIGALLGHFVNPNWIWLAAFVGAGLTFAGITNTCGMGMLLAKMPWNRR